MWTESDRSRAKKVRGDETVELKQDGVLTLSCAMAGIRATLLRPALAGFRLRWAHASNLPARFPPSRSFSEATGGLHFAQSLQLFSKAETRVSFPHRA
ncbi:hypothetical protein AK812_SmicGene16192 [Symbiodinium microadriaticum]|uniref:Uncharacterized protein n=1 Tax=Symbiodinium microadriaticum TaxID=2951 RepID=A0A1Q9E121_SYMMI|nr:hypothetical protein AK812_SmicGene16192 [Symbiodinium microadriaticum]